MAPGMDITVHAASTADLLTGAGTTITGTNNICVDAAVSDGTQVKAILAASTTRLVRFCFDFRKSRLLQCLVQPGNIRFQ